MSYTIDAKVLVTVLLVNLQSKTGFGTIGWLDSVCPSVNLGLLSGPYLVQG